MTMLVLLWCLERLGARWFQRAGTKVVGEFRSILKWKAPEVGSSGAQTPNFQF